MDIQKTDKEQQIKRLRAYEEILRKSTEEEKEEDHAGNEL